MQDKQELLELHDKERDANQNLSGKMLFVAYASSAIALIIFLPKIYITNQIYYLSRDIDDLSGKRDVLFEENRELRLKLEQMRYKYQVIDAINLK